MNASYQASLVNRHVRRFTGTTLLRNGLPYNLLLFFKLALLGAVVEQLLIHLHEELQRVVNETVNRPGMFETRVRL